MTVSDLINAALIELGVLGEGEVASADGAAYAFDRLNDWIDSLATEQLTVYQITRTTWTLTSAATISVGSGATVNTARPVSAEVIDNIGFIDTSVSPNQEYLLGPVLTEDAYAAIPQKSLTAPYPTAFYYAPTYPTGTLKPFPLPTNASLQGVIYAPTPVSEFAALTTTLALPPGYRRFLRTNLALEIAPAFNATVGDDLKARAADSKAAVKRTNTRLSDLHIGVVGALFGQAGPP